ncbi:putative aminohydrolase SsnA [Caldisericum exile]|uniref:Hydrolase n=1 Tax=Caldisericum exile (strain DSM 21853 / NBRC 104410 / AZM16c01) TaxID=511051 RepID=A0A7U6GEP3_CALEA|nr:putative aminohydrolase SsnA [Caldisericum exile]BAL81030.1 putative hydrolase [Caldisericum exile AZM16c01]
MKVLYNGKIITLDKDRPYIENGAIAIDDGVIFDVGTTQQITSKYKDAELYDLENRYVIPGFINTHMHLYSTFARGFGFGGASPYSFKEILEQIWWKLDKLLISEEEIYYSALMPAIEGLKSGTTTIIDHHASFGLIDGSLDIVENALRDVGIRGVLAFETSDRWGKELSEQSIRENERYIKKEKDRDFFNALFGLHASFTLSDETLERVSSIANSLNVGFHIHVAEGIEDVESALKVSNKRTVERLKDFGILKKDTLAIHCININDVEIDILNETHTTVIHNPESNMNNGVGVAPILEMDRKGILIGLGTDGYTPSMIESVKVAYILPKLHYKDPRVGSDLARRMLFENNASVANRFFNKIVGVIKEGAYADLVVLDYNPPTPLNEDNFFFHLIFGIRENSVRDVFVHGRLLVKDQKLTHIDEIEVSRKSQEIAKNFWRRF